MLARVQLPFHALPLKYVDCFVVSGFKVHFSG